jgi:uncharacterized protein
MGEVRGEVLRRSDRGGRKPWRCALAAGLALALAGGVAIKAAHDTLDDPLVRQVTLPLPGLPATAGPLRVLLMSDLHVAGPDMPPERLAHIVSLANRLHPDIVMIAGDFVSDKHLATRHYPIDQAVAPLKGLRSRWGTVAVLGNHDYLRGEQDVTQALTAMGIRLLHNQAARIGPLSVGGIGDYSYGDALTSATLDQMRRLGPPYVLLAHEPDSFNTLTSTVPLMLAGHTHCGQIVPPLIGPLVTGSHFGRRYVCGLIAEHGARLIVSAGLGTSDLPVRYGAHNDMWLVTLTAPPPPKPPT